MSQPRKNYVRNTLLALMTLGISYIAYDHWKDGSQPIQHTTNNIVDSSINIFSDQYYDIDADSGAVQINNESPNSTQQQDNVYANKSNVIKVSAYDSACQDVSDLVAGDSVLQFKNTSTSLDSLQFLSTDSTYSQTGGQTQPGSNGGTQPSPGTTVTKKNQSDTYDSKCCIRFTNSAGER